MASEDEKTEGKGFKVSDRRRFSPETGEARPRRNQISGLITSRYLKLIFLLSLSVSVLKRSCI